MSSLAWANSANMFIDLEDSPHDGRSRGKTGKNGRHERTLLEKGTLYIMDDDVTTESLTVSVHSQHCKLLRELFEECSDYRVETVPNQRNNKAFIAWTKDVLSKQSHDELAIIYFEGNAGSDDEAFELSFQNRRPSRIDAREFLEVLSNSEKQVLVIVDGNLDSRFEDKAGLRRRETCTAALEIIGAGYPGQNSRGKRYNSTFTESFIRNLRKQIHLARGTSTDRKKVRNELYSIPQLLQFDRSFNNNPINLRLSTTEVKRKTSANGTKELVPKVTTRLYLNPQYMIKTGKFAFECHITKDTEKIKAELEAAKNKRSKAVAAQDEDSDDDDEGYHESDEMFMDVVV